MSYITYANKSQTAAYNAAKWNAQDANEVKTAVNSKVDEVAGKQLSTEDYSTVDKAKLATLVPPEIAATYAAIDTMDATPRLIYVDADETNNGDSTLYLHTGTVIRIIQILQPLS